MEYPPVTVHVNKRRRILWNPRTVADAPAPITGMPSLTSDAPAIAAGLIDAGMGRIYVVGHQPGTCNITASATTPGATTATTEVFQVSVVVEPAATLGLTFLDEEDA